jgi:hypothetical protein
MNQSLLFVKILILIVLAGSLPKEAFSQVRKAKKMQHGLYFAVNADLSRPEYHYESTLQGLQNISSYSYAGSAELGFFLCKNVGVSTGFGYLNLNNHLKLDSYDDQFITVDSENEEYTRHVKGQNLTEIQYLEFYTIPLNLYLRFPLSKKLAFFLQAGIDFATPISQNYSSNGIFTFKGYYKAYNVMLENLPKYGFPTNEISKTDGKLEYSSFIIGKGFTGFDLYLRKNIQLALSVFYSLPSSNLYKFTAKDFHLSQEINQINSITQGTNDLTVKSMGINFKLRFYLF